MATTFVPEVHIRKRQYQPSISSYFANRDAPSSSAPERARSSMLTPLPEDTQASLLSVGMRVRKSVPEGYKTHKTMGMQEFPFPSTAPVRKMERTCRNVPTKELMPFCGLHKTGGWGAQEGPSSSAPAGFGGFSADEDDIPGMTISQHTLFTQAGFGINERAHTANSRKRTYEEEVEDDLDAYFDVIDSEPAPTTTQRTIAKMKQPTKQKSLDATVRIADPEGNDFVDALFLAAPDGMDVDEAW